MGFIPIERRSAALYHADMSAVDDIENAASQLSSLELAAFRAWFAEFDAASWDRQFEEDAAAGRLDYLADAALDDDLEGRCTEM